MSKWVEIRNNFEEEGKIYIDAWKTCSDDEEGKVIAKVDRKTKEVEYLDETAKTDSYAQSIIKETIIAINEEEINIVKAKSITLSEENSEQVKFTVPVAWFKEKAKLHGVEEVDSTDDGQLSDSLVKFIWDNINNLYKLAKEELYEITEICPYCDNEQQTVYWNTDKYGYEIECTSCGEVILLCDDCGHSPDNEVKRCDWCNGKCFRNKEIRK